MYIYDILLNFKKECYDFFEWNMSDSIIHIKKMPIIKILGDDLKEIYTHDFILDDVSSLNTRTEYYTDRNISTINACIFTDGSIAFAVKFNGNKSVVRSRLLIDEEEEALKISKRIPIRQIKYRLLNEMKPLSFKTRKQINNQVYLTNKINKLSNQELMYLYFDFFGEMKNDRDVIINKLTYEINNNVLSHNIINEFLKLLSI